MQKVGKALVMKKLAALLCAAVLILNCGAFPVIVHADDEDAKAEIAALNEKYEQLEEQKKALTSKITGVQSEKKRQSQEKGELEQQISLTTQEIELLTEKISYLDQEIRQQELAIEENDQDIAKKEEEILVKQDEISKNEELLRQRLRRSYMAGEPSTLEVLLGSDSFFNMLSGTTMVTRMVSRDKDLLAELADEKTSLEEDYNHLQEMRAENERIKESFEENKAENEEAKALQDERAQSLAQDVQKISSTIQTLEDTEREYYANQAKIQAEMKAAQEEVAKIYASLEKSKGEYTGGQFGWPLPGYSMLTSYYGWRFNNSDFHTGLDISGSQCYGKTVVAANPGTVAFVNTSYTAGVGYGIYLIIDHGGGYSTLYAHLSAIDVSVGDVVARGTPIAKVGATGWATGPHLHFEVRIDGKTQNPLSYLGAAS